MRPTPSCRAPLAVLVSLTLAGCGEVAESFARTVDATYSPSSVTVFAGSSEQVTLTVTCADGALDTAFGRLNVEIKIDPDNTLPASITTSVSGDVSVVDGFYRIPCRTPTSTPNLSTATLEITLVASTAASSGSYVVPTLVRVEPLTADDESRDSTIVELGLEVVPASGAFGTELLANPSFELPTLGSGLPTAIGGWKGDLTSGVQTENGIAPHEGSRMLRFVATGSVGSTNTVASQQWQIVNTNAYTTALAGQAYHLEGSVWVNRIDAGVSTDRRFDVRLLAFDGPITDFATRFAAATWLEAQTASVDSVSDTWQLLSVSLTPPAGTTYVVMEIYAFEDVVNDSDGTEFAGHYADDASLVFVAD